MENKYYTPDIEDIRAGYECEIWWNWNTLPKNEWCTVKAFQTDTKDFDLSDFTERISKNEIRTPYLTKEQIENEGWKNITNPINIGLWSFEKSNRFLTVRLNDLENPIIIEIIVKDPVKEETVFGFPPEFFRFMIPCPSINEFRYICKLLKIN